MAKKSRPKAKHKKYQPKPRELRSRGWAVCGFDISMSSIAGAAIGYDATLQKFVGPKFVYVRWEKDDEYFDRLSEASHAELWIGGLVEELGLLLDLKEIFIAQEEPWPVGMAMRGGVSSWLKQQAEISGAFLGGAARWGYTNIAQMNSIQWRKTVATDLGITTHHSKWRSPELAARYNCAPKDSGKFRSKDWALGYFDGDDCTNEDIGNFTEEIPDWPDIIHSKDGNKPRPEGSVAKAIQPDDRYDALAVMWSYFIELHELGAVSLDELTLGG
jgi:hypothetical protein